MVPGRIDFDQRGAGMAGERAGTNTGHPGHCSVCQFRAICLPPFGRNGQVTASKKHTPASPKNRRKQQAPSPAIGRRQPRAAEPARDSLLARRLQHAWETLAEAGILDETKDARLTVRLQGRLLDAARQRTGIKGDAALVSAGLALLAAQDDFGGWLVSQQGRLSDDFDLGL